MGIPQFVIASAIAAVLLVVVYRLGYRKGYRRALTHATKQRGHPSDPRAYKER
jgi:hypothetical protein